MENSNKILVERESYTKNDKTYFNYFIRGIIRGREVKIDVAPPMDKEKRDFGGYTVLDIVFNDANQVDLVVRPFEIKGDDGKVFSGKTLLAQSIDENGEIYECTIKPLRQSDKTMLNMLLR